MTRSAGEALIENRMIDGCMDGWAQKTKNMQRVWQQIKLHSKAGSRRKVNSAVTLLLSSDVSCAVHSPSLVVSPCSCNDVAESGLESDAAKTSTVSSLWNLVGYGRNWIMPKIWNLPVCSLHPSWAEATEPAVRWGQRSNRGQGHYVPLIPKAQAHFPFVKQRTKPTKDITGWKQRFTPGLPGYVNTE